MNRFELHKKYCWENPCNQRYYTAYAYTDLLDDWIVMTGWGLKNTRLGRLKPIFCENAQKAKSLLMKIHQRRYQHGYDLAPA